MGTDRKKRMITLFLALALVFSTAGLTGCAGDGGQDENTLTLMINASDSKNNYIGRIIDLYEQKTGNKIKLITFDQENFDSKVRETFTAGTKKPDLLFHFNDSGLEALDIEKNFYYLNDEEWVDELTDDVMANSLDKNGNVLGLPFWENSLSGCYYNKTILDSLGLRPAATQSEFDALCGALKAAGYTPVYWASNACNWMFQFGLDPVFADDPGLLEKLNRNEIAYADIPAVVDMVTWLDEANRKGWFNSDYADAEWDNLAPAMADGEAVFLFSWDTWFDTDMDLAKGKYTKADFAVMPVFLNTVEEGTYEGGNMNMLMVTKDTPRLKEALAFLNFCAEPDNYNAAFDGVSTLDSFKNQTTNMQSKMVTDALVSVEHKRRVSTAWPKIIGYQPNDVGDAVLKMFRGEVDVSGCIALMDESRMELARSLGADGF